MAFAVSRGLAIFVSFQVARFLGREGFGEYSIVNTTSGMIGGMAGLGIGSTVVKHLGELRDRDPDRASRILALCSAVTWASALLYAVALVTLAPWMAARVMAAPHLAALLRISAFTVALGVINSVQTCSLTGCEAFRTSAQVGAMCSLAQAALVLVGAWGWGIEGAIWGLALSMLLAVMATRLGVRKEWRRHGLRLCWQDARYEWRVLFQFSLPTFLSGVSVGPVLWGCNALLANQPNGYAEIGLFAAAGQWQQAVQLVPSLMGTALLPVLSERCGRGDWAGSLSVMWKTVGMVAWVVVPVSAVLCLASPWIMQGYGRSFVGGHWVLVLAVTAAALSAIVSPVGALIAACGRMWIGCALNTGWGAAMVLAAWSMVHWGAEGLAGALLVAYLLHAVWTLAAAYLTRLQRGSGSDAAPRGRGGDLQ